MLYTSDSPLSSDAAGACSVRSSVVHWRSGRCRDYYARSVPSFLPANVTRIVPRHIVATAPNCKLTKWTLKLALPLFSHAHLTWTCDLASIRMLFV